MTRAPWVIPSPTCPSWKRLWFMQECVSSKDPIFPKEGTTLPFELFGAPFIDSEKLIRGLSALGLDGVVFRPHSFQPSFQKHAGLLCNGAQIHVIDRSASDLLKPRWPF